MASKSKRRRRVLGASCILAALIIAASSFAWFTSKDEVTNRLTANADYGVSIVESFSPPANWLPGQDVNKDVYAVNTGNVDAFVKETVSGVLDYTFEKKVNTFDAAKCLKLTSAQVTTIDGVTTNEGGGFLAWAKADDGSEINVGAVNSARQADGINNTWAPTKDGVYIFRRSIDTSSGTAQFTYAGYYYKGGKYYKIVIGDDAYRATETAAATAGNSNNVVFDIYTPESALDLNVVTIDRTNGTFTGSPKIAYVVDQNEKSDVTFVLDNTTDPNKPRLVVEYSANAPSHDVTVGTETVTYDASAWAARTEVDYYNKLGELNKATVKYEQAKADNDYASALATARDNLITAATERKAKYDALNSTTGTAQDLQAKWEALVSAAKEAIGTAGDPTGSPERGYAAQRTILNTKKVEDLFGSESVTASAAYKILNNNDPELTQSKANYNQMNALWSEIETLDGKLWDDIKVISTATSQLDPSVAQNKVDNVKRKLAQLVSKINAYADAYSEIVNDSNTATTLNLDPATTHAEKVAIQGVATAVGNLSGSMDTALQQYKTAWNNQADAVADDAEAQAVWVEAINNYNTAVNAAKAAYDSVVGKTAPTSQPGTAETYSDNSTSIVPYYSMQRVANANNPALDATQITTAQTPAGFADIVANTFPGTATPTDPEIKAKDTPVNSNIAALETAYNTAKTDAENARIAFEDAKAEAAGSSKITMYVYLDKDYATNWTMNPDTNATQEVEFYLNKILAGGETSKKLIDSVEFANTVQAKDFKNLTFDLNVGLRSAQITFDDQGNMTHDAVLSPDFNMSVDTITDSTKAVTWSQVAPPAAPAPNP